MASDNQTNGDIICRRILCTQVTKEEESLTCSGRSTKDHDKCGIEFLHFRT